MTVRHPAFSLIELLVAVAILALLTAILVPSLSTVRAAAQATACLSNLRQGYIACRIYADANLGFGPAIGEPYSALPNWGLVVQRYAGTGGSAARFRSESVLVCPSARRAYAQEMNRTYAMNATGHAGLPGDPDNYDDPQVRGHIRFDRARYVAPLLLDSARTTLAGSGPPSSRTAGMIDFRQADHVGQRLDRFHAGQTGFNASMLDGSAGLQRSVEPSWQQPLP